MKIGLVRREFGGIGGAELYVQRIMKMFVRAGHSVTFATSGNPEDLPEGVALKRIDLPAGRAEKIYWFEKLARRELALKAVDCVFSLERMGAQDVYRAGDGVHSVWLNQKRKYTAWWRRPFVGMGKFHKMVQWLERQTLNPLNTRRIIVNSEMVKREILENSRFPEPRIHVVRNGVEKEKWKAGKRDQTREKWGFSDNHYVLLFAGSGWERKGLKYVLDAIKLLGKNYKLVVAGKGKRPVLCPPNATFLGPVADLENAYAAADLLVFPPIYEPSANVVYEALSAGLPVVTTRQNGAAEIIDHGENGTILNEPTDKKELVKAICEWRDRPAGYRVSTRFDLSIERNFSETMEVLELACKEKSSRQK